MQDIHGIRPPVMTGLDPALVKMGLAAGAVLLVLAVMFFTVRYFLNKRKKGAIPELVPGIPPYDQALGELDRMARNPVRDLKAFYFQLGRVVKAYMGGVFGVSCLEMTTQELIRTVRGLPLSRELKQEIARFQEICDPFRYAPVAPSREQALVDLDRAKHLVERVETELTPENPGQGDAP